MLREPRRIDAILGALRDAVQIKFTVKTRLGFGSPDEFDQLLAIYARHSLDALTVHARTVAQMYRLPVHYDRIRQAAETMACPVIANGHVYSAAQAQDLLTRTGARGLMIGRGAIRNPWLFNQVRQQLRGEAVTLPTGRDVADYVRRLWDSQAGEGSSERKQCERMKKFLNYLGEGVPGSLPAPNPPHGDGCRLPPDLPGVSRPRRADGDVAGRPRDRGRFERSGILVPVSLNADLRVRKEEIQCL